MGAIQGSINQTLGTIAASALAGEKVEEKIEGIKSALADNTIQGLKAEQSVASAKHEQSEFIKKEGIKQYTDKNGKTRWRQQGRYYSNYDPDRLNRSLEIAQSEQSELLRQRDLLSQQLSKWGGNR